LHANVRLLEIQTAGPQPTNIVQGDEKKRDLLAREEHCSHICKPDCDCCDPKDSCDA